MSNISHLSKSSFRPHAPAVAGATVLVAEDDRSFAQALQKSLNEANMSTLLAHDGNVLH